MSEPVDLDKLENDAKQGTYAIYCPDVLAAVKELREAREKIESLEAELEEWGEGPSD